MSVNILSKFEEEIERLFIDKINLKVTVALSGGSDSLALVFLLHDFLKVNNGELFCITIDHGLRAESSKEALKVNKILSNYNINHQIIRWLGKKPTSNLQEEARNARYKLLCDFCLENNIDYLATGHQQDDQAENFVIRAEHGSGLYGLSGIPAFTEFNKVKIIRPLLWCSKQMLQDYLRSKNIEWIEDPSNQNEEFTRVRARNFLKQHPEWIVKLANISKNLSRAKDAIEYILEKSFSELVVFADDKTASIELVEFNQLPQEIRFRMILTLLQKISNEPKAARGESVESLLIKLSTGVEFKASTLSQCLIARKKDRIVITHQPQKQKNLKV